jgi:hypothetical protein
MLDAGAEIQYRYESFMKILFTSFLTVALLWGGPTLAQTTAENPPESPPENSSDAGEPQIPTEVSEPPYAVGDLVVEQGYYLDRGEDANRINIRIVDNQFRLYWIDENGLIAEPEATEATLRRLGSVRGRPYHQLSLLPEGAGLGTTVLVLPPHSFNAILYIGEAPDRAELTHSFRYLPSMNAAVDPTVN